MQLGSEYLTSNTHIAYPFEENATGLDYNGAGSSTKLPVAALVDAALIVQPGTTAVYLTAIENTGLGSYRVQLTDQLGATIYDNELSVPAVAAGTYSIFELPPDTPSDNPLLHGVYGRLLVSKAWSDYVLLIPPSTTVTFGTTLPFAQRALLHRPQRLLSLEPFDRGEEVPPAAVTEGANAIKDHVKLMAGYNMSILAEETDDSDTTALVLTAASGFGAGQVPCDITSGVQAAAQVPQQLHPDSRGNVRIVGDPCYAVIPHRSSGEIEIQGGCYACCDCDDFVDVGEELRALLGRTKTLFDDLTATHQGPLPGSPNEWGYEDAVTWWNANAHSHGATGLELAGYGLRAYDAAYRYGSLTFFVRNWFTYPVEIRFTVVCDAICTRPLQGWRVTQGHTGNVAWPAVSVLDTIPQHTAVRYLWELMNDAGVPPADITVEYRKAGTSDPFVAADQSPVHVDMV